jgi:AmiR/NasT family two-component response regulator
MKPYCILKGKPDIVLMDIQMPNKMDMKQRERSLIVLWVPNSNCGLNSWNND